MINIQLLIEELKLRKKLIEDGPNTNNSNGLNTNNNIEINIGQRRIGRSNINLDYRTMSGIRNRNTNTNNNNNHNTNSLDRIKQQLNSTNIEWVDLKALCDNARKEVTAKERELKHYTTGRIIEDAEFCSFALDIAKPAIKYIFKTNKNGCIQVPPKDHW